MQGYNVNEAQELINLKLDELYKHVVAQTDDPKIIQRKALEDIDAILMRTVAPNAIRMERLFPGEISLDAFLSAMKLNIFAEGLNELQRRHEFQSEKSKPSKEKHRHLREDYESEISAEPYLFELKGEELVDNKGTTYKITKRLEGRGQKGLGNFYSDGHVHCLIKEDDAYTCILEATAYFVREAKLLPPALEKATNFATVGVVKRDPLEPMIVSVQPSVMPRNPEGKVKPWDVLVYKAKRAPKTPVSWESWYSGKVDRGIAELNSSAQWDLAAGIFTSEVAGDESMHLGQFMSEDDGKGNILAITRIDLGARERHAVSRDVTKEANPYTTSAQYQSIGQFGKDYCGALMKNPQINQKVTLLWARLGTMGDTALKNTILKSSQAAFIKQFSGLPEEKKREALDGVLAAINDPAKLKVNFDPIIAHGSTIDEQILSVAQQIATLDSERAVTMKNHAVAKFHQEIELFNQEFKKYMPEGDNRFELLANLKEQMLQGKENGEDLQKLISSFEKDILQLTEEVSEKPDNEASYRKIKLLAQANLELLEILHLNEMYHPTGVNLNQLDNAIKKYQTFSDCADYCLRSSATTHKKMQVNQLMKEAHKGTLAAYLQKNPAVAESLSTHTSTVSSLQNMVKTTKTQGEYLARKLFKRYGVDLAYLKLTPLQRLLLEQAENGKYKDLKNTFAKSGIHDVLAKDTYGRTALHHLMANINPDNQDAMDALAAILQKSLGGTHNTNLDIADIEGKTPLHVLLENPHAQKVIGEINARKISYGYMYGANQMQHFFKDPSKYTEGELEKVVVYGEKAKQSVRKIK